jgi:hypothetical protein
VDVWNRDELYVEVWEQPMATLAKKYGISDVMLGKVCRRLSIPVPGRGFWAKKIAGQLVKRPTLPKGVNIPVVQRHITNPTGMSKGNTTDDMALKGQTNSLSEIDFSLFRINNLQNLLF